MSASNDFSIHIDTLLAITKPSILKQGSHTLFNGVNIDFFLTQANNLYIALDGTKYNSKDGSLGFSGNEDSVFGLGGTYDGHKRLEEAYERGATCFIVDKANYEINIVAFPEAWILVVNDSLDALAKLAQYRIKNTKTKVVGITGSTGKTSTTYAIASCLRSKFNVRQFYRTRTSFLGLAIDVLTKTSQSDDFLVVEMQMDGLEQIARFCTVTPPDLAIITSVNNSHVERIGSVDSILKAKLEIYNGLRDNGRLVLNADNSILHKWMTTQTDHRLFTYGLSPAFDVHASHISLSKSSAKVNFDLSYRNETLSTSLTLLGAHAVYTGLAAASVCLLNGLSLLETCDALRAIKSVPGRLQCFRGQNNCFVLDDAYNANLFSMLAAIDCLLSLPATKRVAFIGSMLELAEFSERDHHILGAKLAESVDKLITVGEAAYYAADEAREKGLPGNCIFCADSVEKAISLIPSLALDGDTAVLVKGSGAMRMDRITPHLLASVIGESFLI